MNLPVKKNEKVKKNIKEYLNSIFCTYFLADKTELSMDILSQVH